MTDSNSARGRNSFDAETGNTLVHFFNRNISPYATEASGPKFDLVPVQHQKDLMVNAARMHAQQEFDRIMEMVSVLQKQAQDIKRRLEITDMVRAARYDFQPYHGKIYWLVNDHKDHCTRLVHMGPNDYTTAHPQQYEYICAVQWLGDFTWHEVSTDASQPLNKY